MTIIAMIIILIVHFPRKLESTKLSRDDLSGEIGRTPSRLLAIISYIYIYIHCSWRSRSCLTRGARDACPAAPARRMYYYYYYYYMIIVTMRTNTNAQVTSFASCPSNVKRLAHPLRVSRSRQVQKPEPVKPSRLVPPPTPPPLLCMTNARIISRRAQTKTSCSRLRRRATTTKAKELDDIT